MKSIKNIIESFQENMFENVIRKSEASLSPPQYVDIINNESVS